MGRAVHRLAVKTIERTKQPGYYCDGGGLYLQVSPTVSKSWIFRYTRHARSHEMGLGSERDVSLAEARVPRARLTSTLTLTLTAVVEVDVAEDVEPIVDLDVGPRVRSSSSAWRRRWSGGRRRARIAVA